jgi:hypothetical protein
MPNGAGFWRRNSDGARGEQPIGGGHHRRQKTPPGSGTRGTFTPLAFRPRAPRDN